MSKQILLSGANGVVGQPLNQYLIEHNNSCVRVSRKLTQGNSVQRDSLQWDMQQALTEQQKKQIEACDRLIHCAPIWFLPAHLKDLKSVGISRYVVFSSTSVIGKQQSQNSHEKKVVKLIADAEQQLLSKAAELDIKLTILRPSMIYGYGLDQNISRIARLISRLKFMLIAGKGSGLRQPVHADDLVNAAVSCLDNPKTVGKTYNLAGGERLTYRQMVERIFAGLKLKSRMIAVPVKLYRAVLWTASKFTQFDYTADMADRMNQDLIYDLTAAKQDFNYQPQNFLEQPNRDLPSC